MFVIVLDHLTDDRWRELKDHPLIEQTSLALSLPSAWVVFTLRDSATAKQAEELADQCRAHLADTATVRVRER